MTAANDGWKKVPTTFPDNWDYKTDKEIEGVLTMIKVDVGPNNSKLYMIERAKDHKEIGVWGSTVLDAAMENIGTGTELKIVYTGEKPNPKPGRKEIHGFEVYTK